MDKISELPHNNIFSDLKKSAIWSSKLAWESSKKLFCIIILCFSLQAVIPAASTGAIGMLVGKYQSGLQITIDFKSHCFWLGTVIFLFAMEFVLTETSNYCRIRLIDETGISLQKKLYMHTASMDLSFFEKHDSLNKLFRVSIGGGANCFGPIQNAMIVLVGFIQIATLFGLMVYLQPLLAFLLILAGIPMLMIRGKNAVEKYNLSIRTTQRNRLSRYFTSRLTGSENVCSIKIFNLADEMIRRFEGTTRSVINEKKRLLRKIFFRLSISVFVYLIVFTLVIFWLSYLFYIGEIEAGSMAMFMLAAFRTIRSFNNISNAVSSGTDSALSIVPILDFLAERPLISDSKNGCSPKSFSGAIRFNNVFFCYPGTTKEVIRGLSFSIEAGQKVAIVGSNGAGKSTLIKLLARFYLPDEGEIYLDKLCVNDLSLRWLHDHIALVSQRPIQFEASVYDNIAFGDWENLKDQPEKVQELAAQVGIMDWVNRLPDKLNTHLGKLFGETTLSQGQWQLLSVARAMARKDAILLFDEPTSNLDINAEIAMFRAIRNNFENRTVLFVSHRFSTVREADRILVLDGGYLVEDGTHEQLINNNGYYATMVRHQTFDQITK